MAGYFPNKGLAVGAGIAQAGQNFMTAYQGAQRQQAYDAQLKAQMESERQLRDLQMQKLRQELEPTMMDFGKIAGLRKMYDKGAVSRSLYEGKIKDALDNATTPAQVGFINQAIERQYGSPSAAGMGGMGGMQGGGMQGGMPGFRPQPGAADMPNSSGLSENPGEGGNGSPGYIKPGAESDTALTFKGGMDFTAPAYKAPEPEQFGKVPMNKQELQYLTELTKADAVGSQNAQKLASDVGYRQQQFGMKMQEHQMRYDLAQNETQKALALKNMDLDYQRWREENFSKNHPQRPAGGGRGGSGQKISKVVSDTAKSYLDVINPKGLSFTTPDQQRAAKESLAELVRQNPLLSKEMPGIEAIVGTAPRSTGKATKSGSSKAPAAPARKTVGNKGEIKSLPVGTEFEFNGTAYKKTSDSHVERL